MYIKSMKIYRIELKRKTRKILYKEQFQEGSTIVPGQRVETSPVKLK